MKGPGAILTERHWKRAALWLCFLGPFFFITYGFANARTACLPQVQSFAFAWERNIPFIPWMIIPYWSIDLLYALSLFLWTRQRDLDRHALRLMAATIVCVCGFLLFPLKFSFERPEISQPLFRLLFDLLESFDQPYNQAPSLHICLLIIVWDAFRRNVPPKIVPLVHAWAAVIAVSVFATYQHNTIDGMLAIPAGLLCCYLIPLAGAPAPFKKKRGPWLPGDSARARRLGGRYALLACALGSAAALGCWLHNGWWSLLAWPSFSFAAVAVGYFKLGPGIFQKRPGMGPQAGTRAFASRVLLAPYEYAAKAYRLKYTSCLPEAAEAAPGIWIGSYPRALPAPGCGVLDLTSEYTRPPLNVIGSEHYAAVPLLDLIPPNERELEHALFCLKRLRKKGPVLVHCALGMSRSALVVACALVREGACQDIDEALERLKTVRPCIVVSKTAAAVAKNLTAAKRESNDDR